jgi:dimethylhistidine N-methyltransferase
VSFSTHQADFQQKMQNYSEIEKNTFAEDILKGLSSNPKFIPSKYFYDDEGARLFQKITELPEYYLTRAETEIISTQTEQIFNVFKQKSKDAETFDLIELGTGDGRKTAILIDFFLKQNTNLFYFPIDISPRTLSTLAENFRRKFPKLQIEPKFGDYFQVLKDFKPNPTRRKILLFLGSNIGNFSYEQSIEFLKKLRRLMRKGDFLFIGFDLQKDPRLILRAYDDSQGITAEFNLNLLRRINKELGGNFDIKKFSHYATYSPIDCAVRSFLISLENQSVFIEYLQRSFDFAKWEAIFTEISQKYSLQLIEQLATRSKFEIQQNFFDSKRYFVDSLWQAV